jgi:hypothetical protein
LKKILQQNLQKSRNSARRTKPRSMFLYSKSRPYSPEHVIKTERIRRSVWRRPTPSAQ